MGGILFAYGPITEEQTRVEQQVLEKAGGKQVSGDPYVRYSDPLGYFGGYAFGNGYWLAEFGWSEDADLLDELPEQAPAF
ncbi:hypothetical protein QT381_04055 [Galbitalea sp. SE-J8]|uniref:hypothetical protein n=1 Tax=Galbitalea sp. SE-J8 TaxID=3054952 RepID=UPI00259CC141|nr:hypothetical protein [Galbitalea sp. SE-J8]MDM4762178.1 hypothetical protein [Galbitalea sp. SE-J8]